MYENNINNKQKAILVWIKKQKEADDGIVIRELSSLAETAGAEIVETICQYRQPDIATVIGKGKLEELSATIKEKSIDIVIFENELTPAQVKNISNVIDCLVIDRTGLILDIFSLRAQSAEGRIQVEIAQLKYTLPRLTGSYEALSRLGGGIGTRGPGETKLETNKRHIRNRINKLEEELAEIDKMRNFARERRKKNMAKTVALVGYTNAGKSSLMNALTRSDVFVENKLFATLDPAARKLHLNNNMNAILIDTVGFIRNLPHGLVASFKSTLEEAIFADLVLVVCDISNPEMDLQREVTLKTLEELKCNSEILFIYNKVDIGSVDAVETKNSDSSSSNVFVSAKTGYGISELLNIIEQRLSK